jgi:hypothetical protein
MEGMSSPVGRSALARGQRARLRTTSMSSVPESSIGSITPLHFARFGGVMIWSRRCIREGIARRRYAE